MLEFWTSLAGELSGQTLADGVEIMQYNWMSEPVIIDCVASKVAATKTKNYGKTLDGLRAFRNQALKPTTDGRNLIQIYYRHSPELAMLLIKNPTLKKEATKIVSHFSMIGEASVNHKKLEALAARNQQIVPQHILRSANRIFALINQKGSKELKADVRIVKTQMNRFARLGLQDALKEGAKIQMVDDNDAKMAIQQHKLAPASRKADWNLIRKNLHKSQTIRKNQKPIRKIKKTNFSRYFTK